MNALKLQRKFPQFRQEDILALTNKFGYITSVGVNCLTSIRKIDIEGRGYVDQATVISAVQKDGEGSNYDQIRATLRECNIDASGRVELEDYVEV
jgi:plastin-1